MTTAPSLANGGYTHGAYTGTGKHYDLSAETIAKIAETAVVELKLDRDLTFDLRATMKE